MSSSAFLESRASAQANRGTTGLSKSLAPLPLILKAGLREGRKYRRKAMRKTYLITAILLLSAVWAAAQTTPGTPQSTTPGTSSAPASTSPSQNPATPNTSSTTTQTTTTQTTQTSSDNSNSIEGCLAGSAGNFTLTDQSGKSWQLAGDTAKLGDHVGHQVRITGSEASGAGSSSSPSSAGAGSTASGAGAASGSQPTFTVTKVKMLSSSCPSSK